MTTKKQKTRQPKAVEIAKEIAKAYTDKGYKDYTCHGEWHRCKLALTVEEIQKIIESTGAGDSLLTDKHKLFAIINNKKEI